MGSSHSKAHNKKKNNTSEQKLPTDNNNTTTTVADTTMGAAASSRSSRSTSTPEKGEDYYTGIIDKYANELAALKEQHSAQSKEIAELRAIVSSSSNSGSNNGADATAPASSTTEIEELKAQMQALLKAQTEMSMALMKISSKDVISAASTATESASSEPVEKHIMLSYNWGFQENVKLMYQHLKERGLPVWMDIEGGMHGNIEDSMAFAVENAHVVIPFMTSAYESSANCKKELSYANDCKVKIIPIMAQNEYKQKGWLGLITAGMLWIDLRAAGADGVARAADQLLYEIASAVPELAKEITHENVDDTPCCGNWCGYWMQAGTRGDMECDFAFEADGSITGKGEDSVGPFTWEGTYDKASKTVEIMKYYPSHTIQYNGQVRNRKRIKGKWHQVDYPDNSGEFSLRLK